MANTITAPAGVKLFKGGPYSDKQAGDKALAQSKEAGKTYNQLGDYGRMLMGETVYGPDGKTVAPPPSGIANENSAIQNYATDVNAPQSNPMDMFMQALQAYGNAGGVGDFTKASDPYELTANESQQLNQGIDMLNQQRSNSMSQVAANLSKHGIHPGDPAYDAAMQRVHQHYDTEVANHHSGYMENLRQQRQNTLGDVLKALPTAGAFTANQRQTELGNKGSLIDIYGRRLSQGTGLIGQEAAGKMGQATVLQNQGQINSANTNNAWGNALGFLGMALGGMNRPNMNSAIPGIPSLDQAGASGVGGIGGSLYDPYKTTY